MIKEDFDNCIQNIQRKINILIEEAEHLSKDSGFGFTLNTKCNCIQRAIEFRKEFEESISHWPKIHNIIPTIDIAKSMFPIDQLPSGALLIYDKDLSVENCLRIISLYKLLSKIY